MPTAQKKPGQQRQGYPQSQVVYRITSYNVCYTKLLRDCKTNRLVSLTGRRFLSCQRSVLGDETLLNVLAKFYYMDSRITSYNVCYTKLLRVSVFSDAFRGELMWRIGIPVSALLLVLSAIPLSFVNARAPRFVNLVFALLIWISRITSYNVCYTKLLREGDACIAPAPPASTP